MGLLLLPLVAVAAVAALALGVPARKVAMGAGIATLGLLVLSVALGVAVVGSEDDGEGGDDDARPAGVVAPAEDGGDATAPADADIRVREVDGVLVLVDDDYDGFAVAEGRLDGVQVGDSVLLQVDLEGPATAHLCAARSPRPGRCGVGVPVDEPADGVSRFLLELVPPPEADCEAEPCTVEVFDDDGGVVASLPVVFGRSAPQPQVSVSGSAPFAEGETVRVRLEGFAPGAELVVTHCVPPGPADALACGGAAAEVPVTVGADGSARVQIPAHIGSVGGRGGECRRGHPCGIGVVGSDVVAPVAELSLAGTAGPVVPGGRFAAGLAIALAAAVAAVICLWGTDWRPVDGDPFAGIVLSVPPGWEHLRDIAEDDADDSEGEPW